MPTLDAMPAMMTGVRQQMTDEEILDELDWDAVEEYAPERPTAHDLQMVQWLTDVVMKFIDAFLEQKLYPYQSELTRRIVESLIGNDGAKVTALFSRQSGKTQSVSAAIVGCTVMLPTLAPKFPRYLKKFRTGLLVGIFAPVTEQAETMFARVLGYLRTKTARRIMSDPSIDTVPEKKGGGHEITFTNSGSVIRRQTAHPKASIESKTYHLIVIDEAQRAEGTVVRKSIVPMGAATNATMVETGTPDYKKGMFYYDIRHNVTYAMRHRKAKQNHFEADYREVLKYNANYGRHIRQQRIEIGADSNEFQMSYCLRWLTEQGMLIGDDDFDNLCDPSLANLQSYTAQPVVVGIDPAKRQDSTVITVVWADYTRPDAYGRFEYRVIAWKILPHGMKWHEQHRATVEFLRGFNVRTVVIDAQGVGDSFVDALELLMPNTDVVGLGSMPKDQEPRAKHLMKLLDVKYLRWPGEAMTKRTKVFQRFRTEMLACQKEIKSGRVMLFVPEAEGHDDMVDSLQLACYGWVYESTGAAGYSTDSSLTGAPA